MRKKSGKYIVYIDQEYFMDLCKSLNAKSMESRNEVFTTVMKEVDRFICDGRTTCTFFAYLFIDKNGRHRKSIEITPLLSSGNQGTLHYLRKMNYNKTRANKHGNKH